MMNVELKILIRKSIFILLLITSFNKIYSADFDLINKKKRQWLIYSSSTGSGSTTYILVEKDNNSRHKNIVVSKDRKDFFIDSLFKCGWTKKIDYKDAKKQFTPKLELAAINFDKTIDKDSSFQFVYKISITDLKSHKTQFTFDTIYGTAKENVIKAIKNIDYQFEYITIQKGTSIIRVRLISEALIRPFKFTKGYVFAPSRSYYFWQEKS